MTPTSPSTRPYADKGAMPRRGRGPFLPDGREIYRRFNSEQCVRSDCRMSHNCYICCATNHPTSGFRCERGTKRSKKPITADHNTPSFNLVYDSWYDLIPADDPDRDFILDDVKMVLTLLIFIILMIMLNVRIINRQLCNVNRSKRK